MLIVLVLILTSWQDVYRTVEIKPIKRPPEPVSLRIVKLERKLENSFPADVKSYRTALEIRDELTDARHLMYYDLLRAELHLLAAKIKYDRTDWVGLSK